ncbi:MAG: recombinase family protein [Gracilibacteraceae bacterium]|jgi:DNA invertase Pin-like site-specific DNA recombinase|nr:recombinase family protein [Gracilibacteraceae bacterium]
MQKVAAYTRVNTQNGGLLESLSSEVGYYSNLIQSESSWDYVGVYADDVSGAKEIREEFERMLSHARDGKIDIILTENISRFTQSKAILLETLRELTALGVEVRFGEQNISTMSDDGKLLFSVLESYVQAEIHLMSEKSKQRIRKGFAEGKGWFHQLFGYDYINRALVPNKRQASVVRRVFAEYISGVSPGVIADRLNSEGVLKDHGGFWNGSMVMKLLTNEKYAGHTVMQKYHTLDPITKETAVNRGELPTRRAENTHPALISEDIFGQAQKMHKIRNAIYAASDGETIDFAETGDELQKIFDNSHVGLHRIFGYDYASGKLTPNDEQAKIVRRIFNEYNNGVSPYVIADDFESEGVPSMFGGKWTAATISRTLANVRYAGHRIIQKRIAATGEMITQLVENTHPPLVSQDVFDSAQAMRLFRSEVFSANSDHKFESVNGELRPFYGFDYVDGEFVPSETEASVVRRVFGGYNSGDSIMTIVKGLNGDGIAMAHGGDWHKRAITNILENEFYGVIVGDDAVETSRQMAAIRTIAYAKNERDKQSGTPEIQAIAKAFERGKTGLRPIFGYGHVDRQLVVNKAQAETVRGVYADYNGGESPVNIAERLNGDGIRTIHHEKWNINFVSKLLTNELYIKIVGKDVFAKAQETRRTRSEMFAMTDGDKDKAEISETLKKTIRKSFQDGKAGLRPLFGYDYANGTLTPNEEQAKTVRRIFDEYISGLGPAKIAAKLNEDGVPTMTGAKWYQATVRAVLANERYAGHTLLQKSHSSSEGKRVANKGELPKIFRSNTHPPLVSQEIFDKAQDLKQQRATVQSRLLPAVIASEAQQSRPVFTPVGDGRGSGYDCYA